MSNITKITLMMLALVLAGRYAQAAEPTMLILSCDGKVTTQIKGGEPEIQPVNNTGLVVNFANRTVAFWGWTAKIESIDELYLTFSADRLHGDIDRVTGALEIMMFDSLSSRKYELLCRVTSRRLF